MLLALRIENFTVVEEVEVGFGPGLTVLTGETGAGKSILVDALGLLVGARADADCVRSGADEAVVEAVFQRTPGLAQRLEVLGLPDHGDEVVLRRVVGRAGRSKVHVNGALASVGVLGQLMRGELDIAGQHAHVGLFEAATHRAVLDRWEGVGPALEAYRAAHAPLVALEAERQSLGGDAAAQEARAEFARFQLDELERLAPGPGEELALEAERRRLAGVERLRAAALESEALLGGDDGGVCPVAGRAARMLEEAARTDPNLGEAAVSVTSATTALDDALRSLRRYLDGLEADPERLSVVEERLDALRRLARKHGADVAGLPARLEALRTECARLEGRRERLAALEADRSAAEARAWEAARALRRERERAARQLERAMGAELGRLALPRAAFTVQLAPRDVLRADGADEVEFLFSANAGEPVRPLSRVASGGEASRLWLALKRTSMAQGGPEEVATVVLDEADAGVSGAVADVVGRMVRAVASGRQVLCITHLPQVAAHADAHLVVEKTSARGRTWSSVRVLDEGAPRTRELARMMSGAIVTSEALAAAEALVRAARESGAPAAVRPVSRARRVA
ncbi:MAG TPA: DNA repair protein RecN [Myxococcaceae bacterium]|nr:DNA repair protein RecN [Myxococcaceae bacterium]